MSSNEMDERREREWVERVASAIGLVPHQLDGIDWNLDENVGQDGELHGYTITFERSDDPAVQDWIDKVTDGLGFKSIGPDLR